MNWSIKVSALVYQASFRTTGPMPAPPSDEHTHTYLEHIQQQLPQASSAIRRIAVHIIDW